MRLAHYRAFGGIGMVAGLMSGLLGVGGGFLVVPLQIWWTRTDPHRASGTSLAAILPIALVGALVYYLGRVPGQVDFEVAAYLVAGSAIGAYLGARFVTRVTDRIVAIVVAILLVAVGGDEFLSGLVPGLLGGHPSMSVHLVTWQYGVISAAGFIIGALSGFTGVGGGIFVVPTLVLGFGFNHHLAQGTSLVAILPTAAIGAITHLRNGNVDLAAALVIGLSGMPSAALGALLALALSPNLLAMLFGLLLLFAANRIWPRRAIDYRATAPKAKPVPPTQLRQ